jgi:outer membrane protein TolC
VLQSKTQVATLIPQLVKAQNAIDQIMPEFKKSLGVNMKDPIQIRGELAHAEIPIKEEEFLQEAYRNNPQMILKLLGVDLNKWAIELAKAGWLPQVNASANYMYRTDNLNNMVNASHNLWSVGITASIAIFDGFATKAKVDEAKAKYAQSGLQKENIMDQLVVDIKSVCVDLKQAKAIIDSQKDSIVEAEEALRLSRVRYENGIGINLDIFDAEVSLAQIQQNLAQGVYDYIMARAQLDRTMGRQFSERGN